jgi:hypothetical protein
MLGELLGLALGRVRQDQRLLRRRVEDPHAASEPLVEIVVAEQEGDHPRVQSQAG